MNELKAWNFEDNKFYTVEIGGEPWFIGRQIASILGYSNTKDAIFRHIDEEDKQLIDRSILTNGVNNRVGESDPISDTGSRVYNQITIINESGLYSLILKSQLPTAKKFKKWVTSEVLPAIRKHGIYAMDYLT